MNIYTQTTSHADETYLGLAKHIMEHGVQKGDRTGTGTKSIFGPQMRFDLSLGFPLLTTKSVSFKNIATELLWFRDGNTRLRTLVAQGNPIWNDWPFKRYMKAMNKPIAKEVGSPEYRAQMKEFTDQILADESFAEKWGDLGPIYGKQWVRWEAPDGRIINQLKEAMDLIKNDPNSRRIIVNAWNPADIEEMQKAGLPPCHCLFQFYVAEGKLSCKMYQRSCDMFLGVPYNIASYALLTIMAAHVAGLQPGEFIWDGGDTHVYNNHFAQIAEQMGRTPRPMPTIRIVRPVADLWDFKLEDLELVGYDPHSAIRAPVAV